MKRRILAVLGISIATAVAAPAIANAAPPAPTAPLTLAQILLSDSAKDQPDGFDRNPRDFDIVTQAILAFPDLTAAASDPTANLTVFLPTDSAFRTLVRQLTGHSYRNEADVFKAVVSLGLPTVKNVLTYHVVAGRIDVAAALKANGTAVPTLNGASFTVRVKGDEDHPRVILQDNAPTLKDPRVIIADIQASNGIAHAINRVLLPFDPFKA